MKSLLSVCLLGLAFTALLATPSSAVIFKIKPISDNTKCLTGNANGNDQGLVFATCTTGNLYQQLNAYSPTSLYQVVTGISAFCGKGICMTGTTPANDETPITTDTCTSTNLLQYWTTSSVPAGAQDGYSHLKNWGNDMCATAEAGGAYVDQYTCQPNAASTAHQTWQAQDIDDTGLPRLSNGMEGNANCLNLVDSNPLPGGSFDAPPCSNTSFAGHVFMSGYLAWNIQVKTKCVDGGGGPSNLYQYDCSTGAKNQKWLKISYPNDDTPTNGTPIMDMLSGLCMTWDSANPGAIVTMSACTKGNVNQYFFANF